MARTRVVMLVRNPFTHESRGEREARALADAGYLVIVVADAAPGLPRRERTAFGEVRRVVGAPRAIPFLRFAAQQLLYALELRRSQADVYHAHDSDALLAVVLASLTSGTPYVYDAHELWLGRYQPGRGRAYRFAYRLFYGLLERFGLRRAAGVVVVSPPIGDHLQDTYGIRETVFVPNYPEEEEIASTTRSDIRSLPGGHSIPPDAPVALYLGHLMQGRGLVPLIDAASMVPELHVALLGRGGYADELRRRVDLLGLGERVHFFDPVPADRVIEYARSADIGLCVIEDISLSYRYSLPNKLFQCMAAGLPIVASHFPQMREIVEGTGAGITIDPSDPRAFAAALASLVSDADARRHMGARALSAARERYHWGVAAADLVRLYGRIAPPAR